MPDMLTRGTLVLLALATAAASCSKGDSSANPSSTPTETLTIVVSATGASPRNIIVPRGSQVTFVNQSGTVHEMYSDPHPEHTDCPEFDTVGRLTSGQSRQTQNLVEPRTCRFHDHLEPFNDSLRGSVVIQ
jgi:hypothetical protein